MKKDFQVTIPAPPIQIGAGIFLLFLAFYWKSIIELIDLWNSSSTYSHGYLIPLVTLYLIISKNKLLINTPLKPSPLLLIPLVFTLLLWLFATITETKTIELSLLPLVFIFTYTSIIGYKSSLLIATALLYLLLAVPIWNILIPTLQDMAVFFNQHALSLAGFPTYIENTSVTIPAGTFEIEDGCSGIRYLVVSLALGSLFSLMNYKSLKPALILLVLSFVFPVILNWIRIYIIILIGHFSEMQSPLVTKHHTFGWVLYGISLIPFYFIAHKLSAFETNTTETEANISPEAAKQYSTLYYAFYITLPLAFMISPTFFSSYLATKNIKTVGHITAPSAVSPWLGPIHYNKWAPGYKNAGISSNTIYIGSDSHPEIALHLYYYGKESADSELINENNIITKDEYISSEKVFLFKDHKIIENIVTIPGIQSRLVWYWYYVNNKSTTSPIESKILHAQELITGKATSSLIAVSTECFNQCNRERSELKLFLEKHHSNITDTLSM